MILDEIVANKKTELETTRQEVPLTDVKRLLRRQTHAKDFAAALTGDRVRLIAEVKRASPSKGVISDNFDPAGIAHVYADNGASAISVLTESKYFQGGLNVLDDVKKALGEDSPPLMRKDFLFDPYQIYEARAHGADALLLIAAVLGQAQLKELSDLAHSLGMECLVEIHDESELEIALRADSRVIGINNRDLRTFRVDLETTERLRTKIPSGKVIVSESGIKTTADMDRMRACGVNAVLIGEALMASHDIPAKMRELL